MHDLDYNPLPHLGGEPRTPHLRRDLTWLRAHPHQTRSRRTILSERLLLWWQARVWVREVEVEMLRDPEGAAYATLSWADGSASM